VVRVVRVCKFTRIIIIIKLENRVVRVVRLCKLVYQGYYGEISP
jgi:hypothetical protein